MNPTAASQSHEYRRTWLRHVGALIVIFLSGSPAIARGEDTKPSLQEVYDSAAALAQSPEGREQAIARYRSVIGAHMENERLYQAAMRDLGKCYEEAGWTEETIRAYLTLARQGSMEVLRGRHEAVAETLKGLEQRHSELTRKIAKETQSQLGGKPAAQGPTGPKAAPPPAASQELVDAIVQRKDPALREKSLQQLREMLAPEASPVQQGSALATLHSSLTANFDRDSFRPLVIPLLKSEDARVRSLAVACLPGLNATSADVVLIAPLAEDSSSEVRRNVGSALIAIGKGEQKEQVIPALTKLLQDRDPKIVERTIKSMWGQYSSPEFDKLLLKLSRDPQYHHNTIYHCLSTMPKKNSPVCQRLIEELDNPDWNNSGRAAWGLTYGVADDAKPIVEEGLLKALPEETNEYTRSEEFQALRRVATERSRPYLTSVVQSQTENEKAKGMARTILKDLDKAK